MKFSQFKEFLLLFLSSISVFWVLTALSVGEPLGKERDWILGILYCILLVNLTLSSMRAFQLPMPALCARLIGAAILILVIILVAVPVCLEFNLMPAWMPD